MMMMMMMMISQNFITQDIINNQTQIINSNKLKMLTGDGKMLFVCNKMETRNINLSILDKNVSNIQNMTFVVHFTKLSVSLSI
jgi:hypothetical protein